MPKRTTLPWIVGASVLGFWEGRADNHGTLPGGACLVSTSSCCEAWNGTQSLEKILHIAEATPDSTYGISLASSSHSPACSLLGVTANITDGSGVCGGNPDPSMTVSEALMEHGIDLPDKSLVGVMIEAGTCQDVADGSCWQATNGSTTHVQWTNSVTYREGVTRCSSLASVANVTVAFSTECRASAPYGMQLRASWIDGTASDNSLCDSDVHADVDELVNSAVWTHASEPGLPRWMCVDIPNTPSGQEAYRVVVYSFGPPPCLPASEWSTTQEEVMMDDVDLGMDGDTNLASAVGLHKFGGFMAMTILVRSVFSGRK